MYKVGLHLNMHNETKSCVKLVGGLNYFTTKITSQQKRHQTEGQSKFCII